MSAVPMIKTFEGKEVPNFKVGDVVSCLIYGKGKIVDIQSTSSTSFPIIVEFIRNGDIDRAQYTIDGRYSSKSPLQTLYIGEMDFDITPIKYGYLYVFKLKERDLVVSKRLYESAEEARFAMGIASDEYEYYEAVQASKARLDKS